MLIYFYLETKLYFPCDIDNFGFYLIEVNFMERLCLFYFLEEPD